MTPSRRVRLRVTGKVQGVGFRWFVRERARRLGLTGYVRNEPDGAVVLEADGPEDLVEALRVAVHRGPEAAAVEAVEVLDAGTAPLPRPFTVER